MVRQTVRLISRWWDISYAEFESYEDWLAWLVNLRLPSKNKLMLEGVFYVMRSEASNTIITESPVRSFEKPRPPSSSIISLSSLHKIRINNFLMAAGVVAGETAAQVDL
ncbi:hypothetical protein Tco_0127665 [Tanacetum coccineum]